VLAANDGVVGFAPNTVIFWEPAPEDDETTVFIGGGSRIFGACMPHTGCGETVVARVSGMEMQYTSHNTVDMCTQA